jgi:hypothetical protein
MKGGLLSLLKGILALLLIPFVVAVTLSFQQSLQVVKYLPHYFALGVYVYIFLHFFIVIPRPIHSFGQKLCSEIFLFSPFLSSALPVAIPTWTCLFVLIFSLAKWIFGFHEMESTLMFLMGFTLAMHVILAAEEVYKADSNKIKLQYFFNTELAYVINLLVVALLIEILFPSFSYQQFLSDIFDHSLRLYQFTYHKLQP